MNEKHFSVMKHEVIDYLHIQSEGVYVDCTLGAGGHASSILEKVQPNGYLYAFDQDESARKLATERLNQISTNYTIIPKNFIELKDALQELDVTGVNGILFDIGVSSMQLDEQERGFSYRYDAKLDMRMNQEQILTAYDVVNEYSANDLIRIFYKYGEESYAKSIGNNIVKARQIKPIETTFELVDIIKKSMPMKKQKLKHPAKKVFQAIRIEVNDELNVFEQALSQAFDLLLPKGRLVVLTFHSLEDKICKKFFNTVGKVKGPQNDLERLVMEIEQPKAKILTNKPLVANATELDENNRSQSAKLRVLEKI